VTIADPDRRLLLEVARRSIRHGLDRGRPLSVDPGDFPDILRPVAATFVTLEDGAGLRGCIGRLEATRPLVEDVADNAYAAAFRDPRFPPLREDEWAAGLDVHISVLTPPEPLPVKDEEDLLAILRPGEDGLILEEGPNHATFLPSVWESLPKPADFLFHLKQKAGLPPGYWSTEMRFQRYGSENFGDAA
jgi:AmmeMemoRadiSam system protein A